MPEKTSAIPKIKTAFDDIDQPESFLLISMPGGGKTTQLWTFPKPALHIGFDPNGGAAIKHCPGIDRLEFFNWGGGVRAVEGGDTKAIQKAAFGDNPPPKVVVVPPTAFTRFIAFWNEAITTSFFDKYKTVMLDSYTTYETAILEEYMVSRGKVSEAKEEQGDTRRKAVNQMYSMGGYLTSKGIIFITTAHRRDKTDQGGNIIGASIEAIGRARQALPGAFSNVIWMSSRPGETKGNNRYFAQVRDFGLVTGARSPDHDIPPEFDITIRDWNHPEEYGLGKYLSNLRAKIASLKGTV